MVFNSDFNITEEEAEQLYSIIEDSGKPHQKFNGPIGLFINGDIKKAVELGNLVLEGKTLEEATSFFKNWIDKVPEDVTICYSWFYAARNVDEKSAETYFTSNRFIKPEYTVDYVLAALPKQYRVRITLVYTETGLDYKSNE